MNSQLTLGELVQFVLANRTAKAFFAYDESTIASSILRAAQAGTLLYAKRVDGTPCGVVTAYADDKNKLMHIHDILTTEPWVLKSFVKEFRRRWPDYSLAGLRFGEQVYYNTNRLCRLVMKGESI